MIADAVECERDDVLYVYGIGDRLALCSARDGVIVVNQVLGGVVGDLGHVKTFDAHEIRDVGTVDRGRDVDFLCLERIYKLYRIRDDLEGDFIHVVLGGTNNQFVLLPVVFVALIGDGRAGLVVNDLIGAGGNGIGCHLVSGSLIGSLGDDGAFHEQGLKIAGSQSGEVETGHIIAENLNAVHGAQLGQVAIRLRGVKAELDVTRGQLVAGLIHDVIIDLNVVGQIVNRGQLLHQAADEIVAVFNHQHFVGGEQDTNAAKAHALEGPDVAGIAGKANDNGRALISRCETCHGQNHNQSQNQR